MLLLVFGLRQVSEMIFATSAPKVAGDKIAIQEAVSSDAPVADVPPDWGTVLPTADVAAGATVSTKCKACHNLDNGGPNQTGPNLWGVIGRKPGSHPGFAYSSGMTDFGAKTPVWDYAHIYEFLKGPQAYINGTKMSFVGLKQREDRINLIAWLRQQSSSPVAIPAADPKAAAAATAPGPPASAAGLGPGLHARLRRADHDRRHQRRQADAGERRRARQRPDPQPLRPDAQHGRRRSGDPQDQHPDRRPAAVKDRFSFASRLLPHFAGEETATTSAIVLLARGWAELQITSRQRAESTDVS